MEHRELGMLKAGYFWNNRFKGTFDIQEGKKIVYLFICRYHTGGNWDYRVVGVNV